MLERLALAALAIVGATVATAASAQDHYPPPGYGDGRDGNDQRYGDDRRDGDDRHYGGDGRGRPSATFYVDDKFHGRSVTLDHPVRRLADIGWDDKISSIEIHGGAWLVCVKDDFAGRCERLDASVRRLDKIDLDDKISSVRPVR